MGSITFSKNQSLAIHSRGENLLVSAAAGAGKTMVLSHRAVALLREGVQPEELLIVTYTKAAAAQMRSRIVNLLSQDSELCTLAPRMHLCQISTLHAFCSQVLHEFFTQAGVDPLFTVLDDAQNENLRLAAMDEACARLLEDAAMHGHIARFGGLAGFQSAAFALYDFSRTQEDGPGWIEEKLAQYRKNAQAPANSPWAQGIFERTRSLLAQACEAIKEAALVSPDDRLAARLMQSEGELSALLETATYESLAGSTFRLCTFAAARRFSGEDLFEVRRLHSRAKELIAQAKAALLSPRAAARNDAAMVGALDALCALVGQFSAIYSEKKAEKAALTYDDLEHFTLHVLKDEAVAAALRERYAHIFVDEYQDASPIQEAILTKIARGNNFFMVGDVKQSIYSFRLADPSLFLARQKAYGAGEGGRLVHLSLNFRSRENILACTNRVFDASMKEALGGIVYDEDAALRPGRTDGVGPAVEVAILAPLDEETDEEELFLLSSAQREAVLVAQKAEKLVQDGYAFGDIAILTRSPRAWSGLIAGALAQRGIPCENADPAAYYTTTEVRAMVNLLTVIDNRRSDVALIGALLAPYAGFSTAELAHIRNAFPARDMAFCDAVFAYAAGDDHLAARLAAFLQKLAGWENLARLSPMDAFLQDLFAQTGFYAHCGALPLGAARQQNLDRLVRMAAPCESLTQLLRAIELDSAAPAAGGDAAAASSRNAVHIMSIHRSKGLEFPAVILCGLGRGFNLRDLNAPLLLHKELGFGPLYRDTAHDVTQATLSQLALRAQKTRDIIAEEQRLLYVGMTRAIDKLILVGAPKESELFSYGALAQSGAYETAKSLLGLCVPPLLSHPDFVPLRDVCGYAGPTRGGGHFAVALCHVEAPQTDAIEAPQTTAPDPSWVAQRFAWRYVPPRVEAPIKAAVTQLAQNVYAGQEEEPPAPAFLAGQQETAAARGSRVHALLSAANKASLVGLTRADMEKELAEQAQKLHLAATGDDISLAARFFASPVGRRALASPRILCEQPFHLLLSAADLPEPLPDEADSAYVQGVIDLLFEENGAWTVVDFKTGWATPEVALARYASQVRLYMRAVARITGARVGGELYLLDRGLALPISEENHGA